MENLESIQQDVKSSQENLVKLEKLRLKSKTMMEKNKQVLKTGQVKTHLLAFQNLRQVISRLDDFLNAEKKLEDLKTLSEDPKNFLLVDQKLDTLLEMQEPLMNMSGQSKFSRKFSETRDFEKEFEVQVFAVFADYLKFSKEDPRVLKNAVQIIVKRAMRDRGVYEPGMSNIWRMDSKTGGTQPQDPEHLENLKRSITIHQKLGENENKDRNSGNKLTNQNPKAKESIRMSTAQRKRLEIMEKVKDSELIQRMFLEMEKAVRRRFDVRLGGKKELGEVLENMKFSLDDLLFIFENTLPLFPSELKVFSKIEIHYKRNIDRCILPVLSNMEELRNNPGYVVYLINWFQKYETLLKKVGLSELNFSNLRAKIKDKMPIFYDNIRSVFGTFLQNIQKGDERLFTGAYDPEEFAESLETAAPEDVASFLHQQLEFFVENISGEMIVSVFQVWKEELFIWAYTTSSRYRKNITEEEQIPLLVVGKFRNRDLFYDFEIGIASEMLESEV